MKILYAGNLANIGYYHVKELRRLNVDIELLMEKDPLLTADPLLRDPSITQYPKWIRFYDRKKTSWKVDILKIMRESKYDLIHAHAELPIFAYISRKPFVAQIMGSDLTEMAFTNSLRGLFLRRAYKKANTVIFSIPTDPYLLSELKIKYTAFLPLITDRSLFTPNNNINNDYKDKFVIFHPSSHIWNVKGNDILIEGFASFVKSNPMSILFAVDWGKDSNKSKELIKSLGVENNVVFLNQLTAEGLVYYYNISDVVADQFITDGIGAIGMETLYCQKPLITKCSKEAYRGLYPEPVPSLDASTASQINDLLEYLKNKQIREEIGKKGKDWMERHLSPDVIARKYIRIYESILNHEKIDKT